MIVIIVSDANGDYDSCFTVEDNEEYGLDEYGKRLRKIGYNFETHRVKGNKSQLAQRVTTLEKIVFD